MAHMLEINDLHYSYDNIHVLKGISLYVDEGEIVTLIGSNGAGKTTMMHTLCGLNNPRGARGEIVFMGKPILRMDGSKIARLGMAQVLEGRHIFSDLSVWENMMVGSYTRRGGGIKSDIEAMYKLFPRLKERKNQMGGTLSGGEQQMLAVARALMSRPKLLLLDEPSLGLAPIIVHEIFEAIKQIAREGTTVLFVEQNTKIALSVAQRGYVLQVGELVLNGTCEELFANKDVQKIFLGME
ncbi:ABC transporter ATP-binding protein [Synergistales bacterium]|nr:ABC transporter ATP-binding protein [Synergistales bacterium]